MALMGQIYSGGIFIVPLMHEFNSKLSETSLVVTMSLVMFYVGGLVSSHLADHFGIRTMAVIGSMVWTLGWILASFASVLWHSIMSQGVMCGVGVALVYWPILSTLPQWFKKYRATAMGFAVLGSGVGSIAISFGGQTMISQLGWRNSLRVIGCIGSGFLVLTVVLVERRVMAIKHQKGPVHAFFAGSRDILRFSSARWFLASVLFFQFSFFVPYTYLASYSASLHLSASFGGFALAMLGVGSAVGRIIFGPLADRFGRFLVYRVTVFLDVVMLALWPICTTEPSLIAFAFFYGMFGGGFAAMFAVVAAELWGPERLSGFFTLVNLVSIPGAFAAGPAVGAIIQMTGTYDAAIGFTAAMMGISFLLVMLVKKEPTPPPLPHSNTHEAFDDMVLGDVEAQQTTLDEALLKKYNVDLKQASIEDRETYIRVAQLVRFRETLPDPPEDVFSRALNALKENPFEDIKQKVLDKFGKVPSEWEEEQKQYQKMTVT
jgi:MFS family permease